MDAERIEQIRTKLKETEKIHARSVASYDQMCSALEKSESQIDILIKLMGELEVSSPEYVNVWETNGHFLKILFLQIKLQQGARIIEQTQYMLLQYENRNNNEGLC